MLSSPNYAKLLVYRHAGEIADMLIGARQGIKQGRFPAILIACKRKNHTFSLLIAIFWASSRRIVSSYPRIWI